MKKLLIAAAVIGVAAIAKGKAKADRETWKGLSESEARERLDHYLPSKVPDDKREEIKDKIVAKMVHRGVIEADADVIDADRTVDLTDTSSPPPLTSDV